MPIRDFLKKKDKHDVASPTSPEPEFKIYRSDTNGQELISGPNFGGDPNTDGAADARGGKLFKSRPRSTSNASGRSVSSTNERPTSSKGGSSKRLSQRLGLRRDDTSDSVPADLPEITTDTTEEGADGKESQWEKRATILARKNEETRSRPTTPSQPESNADLGRFENMRLGESGDNKRDRSVSSKRADDNIQEAIRLHEAGELVTATKMFGRLADPNGENNALSQVLYGLALRHGWGCTPDTAEAVKYLSLAASNAALVEESALKSGMKKGGAAKGELVLAIYELANCFRNGWGVQVDKVAAKQFYETAANLGDTDAMNEVAWCYLEGFGCKKDKYAAAKYYRKAEDAGNKTLGNTWIWKDKYNEDD